MGEGGLLPLFFYLVFYASNEISSGVYLLIYFALYHIFLINPAIWVGQENGTRMEAIQIRKRKILELKKTFMMYVFN
jgi:hypothetical protein